jgi:uncharacterized membrane protein
VNEYLKKMGGSGPLLIVVLGIVGALDSAYLAWLKITGSVAACGNYADCEAVNSSRYAEVAGVPIAILGLLGYLAILGVTLLEIREPLWKSGLRLAFFGFTLAGTLYSVYLTYIEVAILRAICPFCVVSAVVMLALFIIAIYRLRAVMASD